MEGDAELREAVNRRVHIVLTGRGAGRAKSVGVVKVMRQKGEIILSLWNPLHYVCYTEKIWSLPDAESQDHIDIKGTTPFHT